MGDYAHHAVIVHASRYAFTSPFGDVPLPDVAAFRAALPVDYRPLVVGPVIGPFNGNYLFAFLPDDSKEGWPESDLGDLYRRQFIDLFAFAHDDGSSPFDVVEVRFGGAFPHLAWMKQRSELWSSPAAAAPGWIDRQGDVWTLGDDGLLHTPETAPFPREHVEKKWGPLQPASRREVAWAEFRDGPNYTPTDRYPVRDAFDAGWTLAHQMMREPEHPAPAVPPAPTAPDSATLRGLVRMAAMTVLAELDQTDNALASAIAAKAAPALRVHIEGLLHAAATAEAELRARELHHFETEQILATVKAVLEASRDDVEMTSTALWVEVNQALGNTPPATDAEVSIQNRCPNMRRHVTGDLLMPCPDCYAQRVTAVRLPTWQPEQRWQPPTTPKEKP